MNESRHELELELAWLVKFLPQDLHKHKFIEIRQAYIKSLNDKVKDIRVREKEGKYTYTIKRFVKSSQETGYNQEETKEISKEEFLSFWNKADKKIKKIRYLYPLTNGPITEVDIYKDNLEGLTVVEVEFPSISAYKDFNIPNWFGKEVTDSKGIYPPYIANLQIDEVNRINKKYKQKPHKFE